MILSVDHKACFVVDEFVDGDACAAILLWGAGMKPWGLTILAGSLALAACATRAGGEDASASKALNIVRAAGLEGVSDTEMPPAVANKMTMADAGFAVSSAVKPQSGIGSGGGVALGVASLLGDLPVERPPFSRHVYAWIPVELAASADDAALLAQRSFQNAFVREFDPEGALEEREASFTPTFASTTRHRVWLQPDCPSVKDRHRDDFDRNCSGVVHVYVRGRERLNKVVLAPPFMNGFTQVRGPIELQVVVEGVFKAWWWDDRHMAAISRNLPPWTYLYVPPGKEERFPRLYVGGELLLFQRP